MVRGRIAGAGCLAAMVVIPHARMHAQDWTLGPFVKPAQVNPIIAPNAASTFLSPMTDSFVHWEELATFNPAAVVRGGKIYLIYRAEDASGKQDIGFHTSRLGLAESIDGLHFTRKP